MPHIFLLTLAALWQQPPVDLAISGARIEVGNGTVIPSGVILLHDGKVAAVGASVELPSGIRVIDAKGMTVYSGFINAYTSDGLKLPEAPSNGTPPDSRNSAPPTMFHENRKGIRADVVAAKCLSVKSELTANYAQGVTTALLSSGTGSIRGNAAVVDYTAAGTVLVPNAGTELALRGGGFGGGGGGYPGTLFGVIANLRQWLADAQYYAAQPPPAKPDASLENLKPLVTGQVPALFAADTSRDISRAVRIADEFSLKTELVGAREAYRQLDLIKRKSIPVIISVDPGLEPSTKADTGPSASPQAILDERHATWVEHNGNALKLEKAGITYAFSTGSNGLSDYLKNVRKLIADGLPRDSALKAMTSGAASVLGVGDRVGTIELGKIANLTIMTGDFAEAKSEVQGVVVEGVYTQVKKQATGGKP